MSISVSDELQLFAQEIQRFLSPNILRDFARDVGFVQRTSKYQAKDLVALCVWMNQNVATTSLTQLSSCLEASTEGFCCKVSEDIKRWRILWTSFMKLLIIHVMRYTSKKRSLVEDFVFVCIWHEQFLYL